jgi:hypothetical protein
MQQERSMRENPVRLYHPDDREQTLAFLAQVDGLFLPPLSSPLRHGSLAAYLDYSLAGGNGRVLLYPHATGMIGYLAYRYDQREDRPLGETIYLSNMAVTESRMGSVLARLFQAMVKQVERDGLGPPERIWAKTWQQNHASAKTLTRMGLRLSQTIPADPLFRGCRDTLIFEGSWEAFARTASQFHLPLPN